MRAHAGDPNETYLSFRQGYPVSHCDENQGDFALYAKGAPPVALSLVGYAIHGDGPFARMHREFGWHSRVRFGSQTNLGGWPDGGAWTACLRTASAIPLITPAPWAITAPRPGRGRFCF